MIKLQKRPTDSQIMRYASPLIACLMTLLCGGATFALLGHEPLHALYLFFIAPLETAYGWAELGVKLSPLLLCAMGLSFCFKAKVWNIGAEGQFIMGALGGSIAALQLSNIDSSWVLLPILITGSLFGLAWGMLAAWLKTRFNSNEILTTIMLNYIALNTVLFAVHGPLKDPNGMNFPESALFSEASLLPLLSPDHRINISLFFALFSVVCVWTILSRSWLGFQIKVLGEDSKATHYAGFKENKLVWLVLLVSGACAGLAGVSEVTGPIGQLIPQISSGYGYAAIIIVFLGRSHPIGILLASFLLALTYMGGENMQIEAGLPKSITGVFQGMLMFFLLAADLFITYRVVFRSKPSSSLTTQRNEVA